MPAKSQGVTFRSTMPGSKDFAQGVTIYKEAFFEGERLPQHHLETPNPVWGGSMDLLHSKWTGLGVCIRRNPPEFKGFLARLLCDSKRYARARLRNSPPKAHHREDAAAIFGSWRRPRRTWSIRKGVGPQGVVLYPARWKVARQRFLSFPCIWRCRTDPDGLNGVYATLGSFGKSKNRSVCSQRCISANSSQIQRR